MRILVCGGRQFGFVKTTEAYANDYAEAEKERRAFDEAMDRLHAKTPITRVISGGATGADTLAEEWARSRCVPFEIYPANWKTHGKRAGPIRNQQMLDEGRPDGVVAFPGGTGTEDMKARAELAGLKVWEPIK